MNHLPDFLIFSTQRSGTHLLESFLKGHPQVNGRGEFVLRYKRTGILEKNIENKLNLGIVMYNQMDVFQHLNGSLTAGKIIHLLRNAEDVALSQRQMHADKMKFGSSYKAHHSAKADAKDNYIYANRDKVSILELQERIEHIKSQQDYYCSALRPIPHLEIHYEDFVPHNTSVAILNKITFEKISDFMGLKKIPNKNLRTDYIKTGINL